MKVFIALVLIGSMMGCTSENETAIRTTSTPLVVNERNVDQSRAHLDLAANRFPKMSIAQQQATTVGLLSNATGILTAKDCPVGTEAPRTCVQNADCKSGIESCLRSVCVRNTVGSGTLTSSTRFTTALHNVNYLPTEGEIEVRFGAGNGQNGTGVGDWIPDDSEDSYPHAQDIKRRSDEREEDLFLANRLFQLGLHQWAAKTEGARSVRDDLRKWKLEYDEVGLLEPGWVPGTFLNQGFANIDSEYTINGEDIVVLKAVAKQPLNFFDPAKLQELSRPTVDGGPFALDRPGMFFGAADVSPLDVAGPTPETPLHTVAATYWPYDGGEVGRLISRPGYLFQNNISEPDTVLNDCTKSTNHYFDSLVTYTNDQVSGMSGGLVIAPNPNEYIPDGGSEHLTQQVLGIGVVHGQRSGVGFDWTGDPVSIAEPKPVVSSQFNIFTGLDDDTVPTRDTGLPETIIGFCEDHENRDDCVHCEEWDASGECTKGAVIPSSVPTGGQVPAGYIGIERDDQESKYRRGGPRRVICEFDQYGNQWFDRSEGPRFPGMVIGLAGGGAGDFGEEHHVGDLKVICAPVTSVGSYTDSWPFLYLAGSVLGFSPADDLNVAGRNLWRKMKNIEHSYQFVENDEGAKQVRPIGLKMCPPNYVLYGITFTGDQTGMVGINAILCRKPTNGPEVTGEDEVFHYLDASRYDLDQYTALGDPYTLDQRIGHVDFPPITHSVTARCDVTQTNRRGMAYGIEMVHDDKGNLLRAHLLCNPFEI